MSTPTRQPNRLHQETSPYLQQHAYNPVDWHAWNNEAISLARELDRPIFLSIGYSACHWCHVMEHESFEDETIAALMNDYFVNIKVDREERPDLDQIYMNSVMALTGRGGWPMSVFLTCELKPFYGGTYWPPQSRMGMPGFVDIVEQVHQAWLTRRERVQHTSEELTNAIVNMGQPQGSQTDINVELLQHAETKLMDAIDTTHGGFGPAPKFPHSMDLRLLLRLARRFEHDETRDAVCFTLNKMAQGGIYDQIGGGFHRYATDAIWLVPHFEKMLYDNALLVPLYLEAFQATGDSYFRQTVADTLDYVLREMTQPGGGFYSTQDADSEHVEGKFFVWDRESIRQELDAEEFAVCEACYNLAPQGNWEGHIILTLRQTLTAAAESLGREPSEIATVLNESRRKLFLARQKRIAPDRDDKILVGWNGLMISAMAQAYQVLRDERYRTAATEAVDFIFAKLHDKSDGLLHVYKDGQAKITAFLDDYAALLDGLIDVYQATFDAQYIDRACQLADEMVARFYDESDGGFFYTANDHEQLITRNKDSQDNAMPSGNSLAAGALSRLARISGRSDFETKAIQTLELLSGQLALMPMSGGQALMAVDFLLDEACEFVIVDGDKATDTALCLQEIHTHFLPNKVILRHNASVTDDEIPASLQNLLTGKASQSSQPTIYICQRGTCAQPIVGIDKLRSALQQLL